MAAVPPRCLLVAACILAARRVCLASSCDDHTHCGDCLSDPSCGWCGSRPRLEACMPVHGDPGNASLCNGCLHHASLGGCDVATTRCAQGTDCGGCTQQLQCAWRMSPSGPACLPLSSAGQYCPKATPQAALCVEEGDKCAWTDRCPAIPTRNCTAATACADCTRMEPDCMWCANASSVDAATGRCLPRGGSGMPFRTRGHGVCTSCAAATPAQCPPTSPPCSAHDSCGACKAAGDGKKCAWCLSTGTCVAIASNSSAFAGRACGRRHDAGPVCPSAPQCLLRSADAPLAAVDPALDQCPPDCGAETTCVACTRASSDARCGWSAALGACVPLGRFGHTGQACVPSAALSGAVFANGSMRYSPQQCTPLERKTGPGPGCQSITSCSECAGATGCGWCGAQRRCLPTQVLAEGCSADLSQCAIRDVTDAYGVPLMATGSPRACRRTLLWRGDQADAGCPVPSADAASPCDQRRNCSACVAENAAQEAAGAQALCAWCEARRRCLPVDRNGTAMSAGNGSAVWTNALNGPCDGCGRTRRDSCPVSAESSFPSPNGSRLSVTPPDGPCAARTSCGDCLRHNASAASPQAGCAWCSGTGRCVGVRLPGDLVPRSGTAAAPAAYCSLLRGCRGCALLADNTTMGVPGPPRPTQCPSAPRGVCAAARNCSECAAPGNEGICAWSTTHGRCVAVQRKYGAACAAPWLGGVEAEAARQCFVYDGARCPAPSDTPCRSRMTEGACLAAGKGRTCAWCDHTQTCHELSTWLASNSTPPLGYLGAPVCALLAASTADAFPRGLHFNTSGGAPDTIRHVPGTRLVIPTCPTVRLSAATGWEARVDSSSGECFVQRHAGAASPTPCASRRDCASCTHAGDCVWFTGSDIAGGGCRRGTLDSRFSLALCSGEEEVSRIGGCPASTPGACAAAERRAAASAGGGSSGDDTCLLAQAAKACSGGQPRLASSGPPFSGTCSCPYRQRGAQCTLCSEQEGGPGCEQTCPGCSYPPCSSSNVCDGRGTCVEGGSVGSVPQCRCHSGYRNDGPDGSCRAIGCVCENGGTCPDGGTTCSCPGNFGGRHCERCRGAWRGPECQRCPTVEHPNILPSCLGCRADHYGFNCSGTCRPCATPGCDSGVRGTGNCTCNDGATACTDGGHGACDPLVGSCTCLERGRYGSLCEENGASAGVLAGSLLGALLVLVIVLGTCVFTAKVNTVAGVHDRFKASFAKGQKGERPGLSADTAISVVSQLYHDAQLGGMAFEATAPWGKNANSAQLSISSVLLLSLPYFNLQGLLFWASVTLAAAYVAYSAVFFRARYIPRASQYSCGRLLLAPAPYVAWTVQTLSIVLLRQIASPLNCVYNGPPGYPPFLLSSAPNELSRAAVVYSAQEVGEPDTFAYWSSVMPLDGLSRCWEGEQVGEAVATLIVLVLFFPTLAWVRPLLAANPLTSGADPSDNATPIEIAYHPTWLFIQLVVDVLIACIGTFLSAFPATAFFVRAVTIAAFGVAMLRRRYVCSWEPIVRFRAGLVFSSAWANLLAGFSAATLPSLSVRDVLFALAIVVGVLIAGFAAAIASGKLFSAEEGVTRMTAGLVGKDVAMTTKNKYATSQNSQGVAPA